MIEFGYNEKRLNEYILSFKTKDSAYVESMVYAKFGGTFSITTISKKIKELSELDNLFAQCPLDKIRTKQTRQ